MIRANGLRFVAVLFLTALTLSLSGCGGSKITKGNYDKITKGMTEAEVEAIIGKGEVKASASFDGPKTQSNPPPGLPTSSKAIFWKSGGSEIVIWFQDGKVIGTDQKGL
jgi:hypothetical protein